MLSPTAWACGADSMRDPGLRGLALGYMLSPTSWACVAAALRCCRVATQGFADSPWATCCRPLRGLASLLRCDVLRCDPGHADSPWATCCRPLRGLASPTRFVTQGFADSPWAPCCRPLRGLLR